MAVFTLSEHEKNDDVVILDKYQFKDRKCTVPVHEAAAVAKILCNYYACTMENVSPAKSAPKSAPKSASVAKAATKAV